MRIESTRWGEIEVPEESVIHFPRGLYGLDGGQYYCLLEHGEASCFLWLQAVDSPAVAMIVTDPLLHFPEYEVTIPDPAAALLQAEAPADLALYSTVTVAPEGSPIYTNLLGPLIINPIARRGMQLILDGSPYKTRHEIRSQGRQG